MDDVLWENSQVRYIRKVEFISERVSKWYPVSKVENPDGTFSEVTEPDGKTYFWSDDPIFNDMESLRSDHGNRQWKIKDGKVQQINDQLTTEQKKAEVEKRFQLEYNLSERQKITEEAQEAKWDGASDTDEAIVKFKQMRDKWKEIEVEVDKL